ncbi:peroxisomal sarcosine oxidase-like [Neocloeon triangulifer]|uniref:peroxisomal sarcosine oxidase-like n=1 Tax=Neocloeon triangulifer TaxID=2078957 RepID=UPI00286EDDC2|nr:peroxisomal sarcosine oxidase-like [Neocloeon triangulifer]
MEKFDYIVVGAGIEGSWTAYQLIRDLQKPSVLLLERFPLPHSRGSSHGQTRIIRHAYPESFHTALMPRAFREWRQLEKDAQTDLLISKPLLCVADESGYQGLDNTIARLKEEQAKSNNTISYSELTPKELTKEFPQASFSKTHRGCIEYSAGILLADKCLATVQTQFKKLGGVIKDGFVVTSIIPGEQVQVKGHHQGVEKTEMGGKVAICPGPWAKKMIEPLLGKKLPIKTLRVPVFYWKVKKGGPGAIPASFIDHGAGEFWGIPEVEYKDMIKLCSHSTSDEADPDDRDKSFAHPNHDDLTNYVRKFFPGLEDTPSIIETCMYSVTPDNVSIIDTIPGEPNIAYACGFSGTGFKKAPCVGLMLKGLLNPEGPNDDLIPMEPFSFQRFE